jgi:nicotinamidase-related amidase
MNTMSNQQSMALLVMDMQAGTMALFQESKESKELVDSIKKAIATARAAKIPVIYVVVGFRKGFPEISLDNRAFSPLRQHGYPALEEPIAILPELKPLPNEVTVTKRRVSAFSGSDLEVVLRAAGVGHLVLTGVVTSGVVLSTLREAADKDFQLSVLLDCCLDAQREVHELLISKIFPGQADVLTSSAWSDQLSGRMY